MVITPILKTKVTKRRRLILWIEYTYNCCTTFFHSCFVLQNHIKARCNALKRTTLAETDSGPSSTWLIFCLKTRLFVPGSSFAFREWSYVTTSIIFDLVILLAVGNFNSLVCLDTESGVTLVDKIWLAKKPFSQKISIMPMSLKVKGITTFKHKSDEFTLAVLYILSLDWGGSEVYVCIKYKLHLIKGLKANILIDNDIFCTEGLLINLANASAIFYNME